MATNKSPTKKSAPRKKVVAERSSRAGRLSGMSENHKKALAVGREEGRAIRRYLEALEAHRPKRGRKRTPEGIRKRIAAIDGALAPADPLTRVRLIQERMNLTAELAASEQNVDLSALEDAFIQAAKSYGARKGISYTAWREAGVDAAVLKLAGVPRTRT